MRWVTIKSNVHVSRRYKIVSERRAVNAAELTDEKPADVQSLASYLCVYDVEKLSDDADATSTSVSDNNVTLVSKVKKNVKFFRSHKAHRPALISISLTLSQTPVYTVRPCIQGLVCCALCLFTSQLSLVLIAATHGGLARLS